MESVQDKLREWLEVLRGFVEGIGERFKNPEEDAVRDIPEPSVMEERVPRLEAVREVFSGRFGWRWRVLSVLAKLYVLVEIVLMVMLYSNTWYLNLLLFLFLAPNVVIMAHYVRLLARAKAESS